MKVSNKPLIRELRDAIAAHAAEDRTAFEINRTVVSYAEFGRRIDAFAAGCHDWGLQRGEAVGLIAPKSVDALAAFFGIMQAGGCACFIEPELAADVIVSRMKLVNMQHLIHAAPIELQPDSNCRVRTLAGLALDEGTFELADLARSDSAMMLFTSGSTGAPKGLVLSHGNLACNARGVLRHTGTSPRDKLLHVMPVYHTNGVNNQLIVPLIAGATILLMERFRAEETVALLRESGITYMTGVPTMYSRMLRHITPEMDFSHLRFLRCGSAPITPALHREIEEAFRVPLVVSYGLSEATCTSTMNPPEHRRIGSIGTVLDGQDVRLLRPGANLEVPAGAEGEICIGGDALMKGYIGSDSPSPIIDGWLRTGDLGEFDENGYLTITGRIKDVIIRGGENISPALIELQLSLHPSVQDCCVVGIPHPDLGEIPIAYIVPRSDQILDEITLRSFIRERLSRIYVPEEFHAIGSLPTNSVGKVDRGKLKRAHAVGMTTPKTSPIFGCYNP